MHGHSRRRLLQGSAALAAFSLLPRHEVAGQQTGKVPRIGFLAVGSREGRAFMIDGFRQGLREHGYVEGQNIVIEYRFSEDRNDRLPTLAAELVAISGLRRAFAAAVRQRAGALIAPGDPLVANRPRMVADIARKHRLPTIMDNKEFVEAGGLLSCMTILHCLAK